MGAIVPYSPLKLANYILEVAADDHPPHSLTPLQLIKLVYIAHGWSFVYGQGPLSSEPAEAWLYGPVMPSLYHAIKEYKSSPVHAGIDGDVDPQELSGSAKALLDAVYNSYKQLSGTQLSSMTHQDGTPWSETWGTAGRNATIPNKLIADHYKELAERRTAK